MSADPRYSHEVLRRFREASGAGDLPDGPGIARGRAGDREQGAEVAFEFAVLDDRIDEARFRAFGCPHFLAGASWLAERLRGASRADLLGWDWREVADALAVPPAKFGRLLTLQDAIRDAAENWPGRTQSRV